MIQFLPDNLAAMTPPIDAIGMVDRVLAEAVQRGASDVHIEPTHDRAEIRFRVDGLLETVAKHEAATGRAMVTRLMVMAQLLTYRLDIPQEGRIRTQLRTDAPPLEMRLAIIPTTHGLRAAVRMPAELIQPRTLEQLGLPAHVLEGLKRFAATDAGMLLVTGPAGSGKTTTIYALLEYIAKSSPGLSIVSLEDPVERHIPGVTQIEVSPFGELTYERALRSIVRQDPQVLMLGEIRDADTASLATQAALSGHRLICTLHASSPGGAIARLLEMGLEPYRITSAVYGVVAQRLLRKCRHESGTVDETPAVTRASSPVKGATEAQVNSGSSATHTGGTPVSRDTVRPSAYAGRVPAAEFIALSSALRTAILARADAAQLQKLAAQESGYISLRDSAHSLVAQHLTDDAEVLRVLGE
jgi:type II secretory ATPase GspE/PulE/Tfp pilus assembly ATPase PilB-like protein